MRRSYAIAIAALALAAFGIGWVVAAYNADLGEALRRSSTGSHIAATACGPIEYTSDGEGPAVLLVHGAGGGFDQMAGFARELSAGGFRAVALSRFGYLRTPLPPDASAEAQAAAHRCLLDALGIERAAIVGVSAGSPSSMQFALRYPERCAGLALLVPLAWSPKMAEAQEIPAAAVFVRDRVLASDFLFWSMTQLARPLFVKTVLGTRPELLEQVDAQEAARAGEVLDAILPVSPRRQGLMNDGAVATSLKRYDLESVRVPTLVVSAADDLYGTYEGARYTAKHVPGARFVGFESGGHLWLGHHDEVMSELGRFLEALR